VSVPLNGLHPNATIHVRITAVNADGQTGSDLTLTTPPAGGELPPTR